MKTHYVYLTTNLITGQQYIGDHTINPNQKIYYVGSGSAISEDFKKYGDHNFFKEILDWFDTRIEACKAQEKYIKLYHTHILDGGYNISWTGGTHCGGTHSKETIQLMKINSKGKNKGVIRKPSIMVEQRKKQKEILVNLKKELYELNPNYCKECFKKINFNIKPQIFCSQTCTALFISRKKHLQTIEKYYTNPHKCDNCNCIFEYKNRYKKYCNDNCKQDKKQEKISNKEKEKVIKRQYMLIQKTIQKQTIREEHFKQKEFLKKQKQTIRDDHFKNKLIFC